MYIGRNFLKQRINWSGFVGIIYSSLARGVEFGRGGDEVSTPFFAPFSTRGAEMGEEGRSILISPLHIKEYQ